MGRVIILQSIAAGLLLAAWLIGALPVLAENDRVWALPFFTLVVFGVTPLAVRGHWDDVRWIADKAPIWGLAFTGAGIIWAAHDGSINRLDDKPEQIAFLMEVVFSLVGNIAGVLAYFWLSLLERFGDDPSIF